MNTKQWNTILLFLLAVSLGVNALLAILWRNDRARWARIRQRAMDLTVTLPELPSVVRVQEPKLITVHVQENGTFRLDGGSKDLSDNELTNVLKVAVADHPEQKVLIRGEGDAKFDRVAKAVNICQQAGIDNENLGFDYAPTAAGTDEQAVPPVILSE